MRFIFFFTTILFSLNTFGQSVKFRTDLIKNWVKTDITTLDGSKYYDPEVVNIDFDLNIINKDSVELFSNGRLNTLKYSISKDSVINLGGLRLKITELSDIKMILESSSVEGYDFKMTFMPKNLYDLTYTPTAYKAKNGEVVFEHEPGRLEPQFISNSHTPMDYIFEKFDFPEYRKAGFVVRFIITSKGEIIGTNVTASSNDKFNDRLVAAVLSTKGMWKPAYFKGEPVNVEMEYNYDLGYNERQNSSRVDSSSYSKNYYNYGLDFLSRGAYKNAATYFQKAIEYNPLNIDAYYKHAEVSFALRKKDEACESLSYLILLEQKKAIALYDKNCK